MNSALPGNHSALKSARLVWLVVLLGLGTGTFTLCIVRSTLGNIRAQRAELAQTQDAIDQLTTDLGQNFTAAQDEMQRTLASAAEPTQPTDWTGRMSRSLDQFTQTVHNARIESSVGGMRAFLSDFKMLHERSAQWRARYRQTHVSLLERKKAVDAALHDMRAAFSGAEGRQRLDLAVKIRRFQKLSGEAAQNVAAQIIAGVAPSEEIAEIPAEISNLALLCERLAGDDEIDQLADLKDNLFAASLFRLSQIVVLSANAHALLYRDIVQPLAGFKLALFGTGYVMDNDHQTLTPGADGLYSLCRQQLELRQQREALRAQSIKYSEQFKTTYQQLDAANDALKDGITGQAEAALGSSWQNLLIITFLCGIAFVLLGKTITRTLGRQIIAIEQANVQLDQAARDIRAAKDVAEAASSSKSEFLANMSHEIRTPMTAILGFADLLLAHDQPVDQRIDCVQTIRRNGEHLLSIINDILDISKIEAGRLTVEQIACSPTDVVADVAALMRVRAAGKNLPLEVAYVFPVPMTMRSDPLRLRQILVNLVGNAIKFTERGSVRVIVRCDPQNAPKPVIHFEVIDTGIGLTPDQLQNLFQPFTQADASTSRKFGGTGLGLTIARRLAQILGGDIEVRSKPGEGSQFILTLPTGSLDAVEMVENTREAMVRPEEPTVAKTATPLTGRILLAEDGPDNQRLINFHLKRAGAQVQIAGNGQIACEMARDAKAKGQPFDLILMDMQMPVLDGYGAVAQLRAEGFTCPIAALTAHAMSGDREKCLRAGCNEYLTKPIDPATLISAALRLLTTSTPAHSTAA